MDAIFYGKQVQIFTPEFATVGETIDVTVAVHGSRETVSRVIIKQGDTIIAELEGVDLDDQGQATVRSLPVLEDTVFSVEVHYYGIEEFITAESTVKVGYLAFIGLLPKWESAATVGWDRLLELNSQDSENNQFTSTNGESINELDIRYNFSSPNEQKHIFVAVPSDYPDIVEMSTSSQQFGIDAFNVIDQIPLNIELSTGDTKTVLYKYFVYKESLVTLSTKVTFKFE